MYSIGYTAKQVQMSVKSVRYYHDIGLVKSSMISEKGYRRYSDRDIRKLVFVRHARAFGFSIETCRELLDLYENPARTSSEVKKIVTKHLEEIEQRKRELEELHRELSFLADACHGDQRPDCPIMDHLSCLDSDDSEK